MNEVRANVSEKHDVGEITTRTRSGRKINVLFRFCNETGGMTFDIWEAYTSVGAGLLDESVSTATDLQAMKYSQTMKTPEKEQWKKAVEEEFQRMAKNNV